jgi:hypothetical protein
MSPKQMLTGRPHIGMKVVVQDGGNSLDAQKS